MASATGLRTRSATYGVMIAMAAGVLSTGLALSFVFGEPVAGTAIAAGGGSVAEEGAAADGSPADALAGEEEGATATPSTLPPGADVTTTVPAGPSSTVAPAPTSGGV